jgi:hypothetical protein
MAGRGSTAWLQEALLTARVRRLRHPRNHRYDFTTGIERKLVAILGNPKPYPKLPDDRLL